MRIIQNASQPGTRVPRGRAGMESERVPTERRIAIGTDECRERVHRMKFDGRTIVFQNFFDLLTAGLY